MTESLKSSKADPGPPANRADNPISSPIYSSLHQEYNRGALLCELWILSKQQKPTQNLFWAKNLNHTTSTSRKQYGMSSLNGTILSRDKARRYGWHHNVLYLFLSCIIFIATAALLLALDVVDVVVPLVDRGVQPPLLLVTLHHTRRSLGRVREGSAKEVAALLSKTFFTSSSCIR